jgi:acetylornithine deacetylase
MTYDTRLASCIELLARMVRIDTVNTAQSGRPDAERPLAEMLETAAGTMSLQTLRLPVDGRGFNLLVRVERAPDKPWILFESHMDTVTTAGMTIDPFGAVIRDGRMYGRGACDTKASGAAMLWALNEYARQADATNNVAVLFTIDEEMAKAGIKAFVNEQLPRLGWRLAGCVVGEPTSLRQFTAHNGVVRWTIRTQGVAVHSSNPSRGRNAISMMAKVIDAIETNYLPHLTASHPLTGRAVASITLIQGGTYINIIPEHCDIQIDRRLAPGESAEAVLPAVQRVLDELCGAFPEIKVSQGEPFIDPPLDPAGNEAWIARVGRTLKIRGIDPSPLGAPFGTDASTFGVAGPAVVLGPGQISQAHTADEWIELAEVERAVNVYLDIMNSSMA